MKNVVVVFQKGKAYIQGVANKKVFTKSVSRKIALRFLAGGGTWKG